MMRSSLTLCELPVNHPRKNIRPHVATENAINKLNVTNRIASEI
jgi:hypothetical protein